MAIEFCPLAADVGNWADWAGVVVAGMGAAAVFSLSRAANRTSQQSLEIARSIHDKQQALADREAIFLASRLYFELNHAANYVKGLKEGLELVVTSANVASASDKVLEALKTATLTSCAQHADQIPSLPKAACDAIAGALASEQEMLRGGASWMKATTEASKSSMASSTLRAMGKFCSACQKAADELKAIKDAPRS